MSESMELRNVTCDDSSGQMMIEVCGDIPTPGEAAEIARRCNAYPELQAEVDRLKEQVEQLDEQIVNDTREAELSLINIDQAAELTRLRTALERISSGDRGAWNCHCPATEIARDALAAKPTESDRPLPDQVNADCQVEKAMSEFRKACGPPDIKLTSGFEWCYSCGVWCAFNPNTGQSVPWYLAHPESGDAQ